MTKTKGKEIKIDPELFIKELPHGSGIDCEWEYIEHNNGHVTFKNFFHAMTEHGYYDGYMPFKFTVFYDPEKNQFDFNKLICNENARRSFFGLKDYLEETIYETIVSNINPNKHIKENQMQFNFYQDPGHGWVKVPRKLLKELKISDKISHFSYQRNEYVYLEEDSDLAKFIHAMEEIGKTVTFKEYHTDNSSKIRNYEMYSN